MHPDQHHHEPHTDAGHEPNERTSPPSALLPDEVGRLLEAADCILVPDEDQVRDHSAKPVPPSTRAGRPYRWKIRLAAANLYTSTADEALAAFIADYDHDPHRNGWDEDVEYKQATHRAGHLLGVIATHVTGALANKLTDAEHDILLRSIPAPSQPPLRECDVATWENEVPLLLMADLYDAQTAPPAGNVQLLRTGSADAYLVDLARTGWLTVEENPIYDVATTIDLRT